MTIPQNLVPPWSGAELVGTHWLNDPVREITVLPYAIAQPGNPTGDDGAAITAAFNRLPVVRLQTGSGILRQYAVGRVRLGPWPYNIASTITKPHTTDLVGAGLGTVLNVQSSAGTGLSSHDQHMGDGGGTFGSYRVHAGTIRDLIIDGTSAGANAVGMNLGDMWGLQTRRLRVQNFAGTGATGIYFINNFNFLEKTHVQATLWGNTTGAVFDGSGAGNPSFEFQDYDFDCFSFAGQNMVSMIAGANFNKGRFRLIGNVINQASAVGIGTVLTVGNAGDTTTHIQRCHVEIQIESDGAGAHGPTCISFGTATSNQITDCEGILAFIGGTFANTNGVSGQLTFGGVVTDTPGASLAAINAVPVGWL